MNIVIEKSGKRFKLKMMNWKDNNWVHLNAEDLIVDSSFHFMTVTWKPGCSLGEKMT